MDINKTLFDLGYHQFIHLQTEFTAWSIQNLEAMDPYQWKLITYDYHT